MRRFTGSIDPKGLPLSGDVIAERGHQLLARQTITHPTDEQLLASYEQAANELGVDLASVESKDLRSDVVHQFASIRLADSHPDGIYSELDYLQAVEAASAELDQHLETR